MLFPAWGRYVYRYNIQRFAQFARRVWDVTEADDEKAAALGVEKMAEYFASLDMPVKLRDFGIPENCADRLADLCTFGKQRSVKSYIDMDYDVIKAIFESCY